MGRKCINVEKEDQLGFGKNVIQPSLSVKSTYTILKDEVHGDGVVMYEGFWRIKVQPSC